MPDKNVLITGANGFLGRNISLFLHSKGFSVFGIGRGHFSETEKQNLGFKHWITSDISVASIRQFNTNFDYIIHCAGGASVATSINDPVEDFRNTVSATLDVLEFIRIHSPTCKLIYPSSAAVYGEHDDSEISITDALNPASPYGFHKKMAEDLCLSYNKFFMVDISIIRFFSVYGPGIKKQLIWDACNKIKDSSDTALFWGTGQETRDWIYISDAMELIYSVMLIPDSLLIVNGGSGVSTTIENTLKLLAQSLGNEAINITFNGASKTGDPCHYKANIKECSQLNWQPKVTLKEGLTAYINWFKALKND